MLVPVYALFVEKVGGGALSAGFTAGALGFAAAISAFVSGRMIDKLNPNQTRNILSLGWLAIGLAILLYMLVESVAALFVVQIILGLVKTVSAPAFDTLYSRHLDKSSTGQEYGVWEASFFLTAGIGAVIGGILVDNFGFNGVFIAMSSLAVFAAAYIRSVPEDIL